MASKTKANGRRYTEAEKAVAVQAVMALGGVVTVEVWKQVQTILKAPVSFDTLRLWLNAYKTPKSKDDVDGSRTPSTSQVEPINFGAAAAVQIVEQTFRRYAERANNPSAVEATDAKDAAKVMADMAKLLQLMQGLPTEIHGWADELTELASFFRENGIEGSLAIREWRQKLIDRKRAQEKVNNG